ncbi:NicO-domain-containing protein [Cylindrobasidium torrendii FP15055 ss-10]|uniref:Nickel/cobalt efflux system n=1 Tax=Cylindrobasidium torrendii FP15055 ss-10 TaxID=1314674 RepID=A0A0D7BQX0_9AGAR|nr:NicO-domain-containing protein [Cylindrobasidium torrendii FP15055 ss-10]
MRLPPLTIFGRSLLLVVGEVLANAICWIVAAVLFAPSRETQGVLGLALLAWTLGLRHALDADHISAIDNATRGLMNHGQLPVTCGLFFSLGHSTIVVVVNVAIAISSDIYEKLDNVSEVGGIVGAAVSGSFLFIVGLANSIILYRILKQRRKVGTLRPCHQLQLYLHHRSQRKQQLAAGVSDEPEDDGKNNNMLMMRLIGPVINFVDRPWKMYPVGILFGFGFDTASSIALLAVSAIAKKGPNGEGIPPRDIVILPLLFTAGMTLIDSLDSILMLYSYSGFPEKSFAIFEKGVALPVDEEAAEALTSDAGSQHSVPVLPSNDSASDHSTPKSQHSVSQRSATASPTGVDIQFSKKASEVKAKLNMMSGLSIVLTLMSILVAFSISLITIMGLIGENCGPCQKAAEAEDGGGLAGRWWRGWANANDNSGYIGAAIIGAFIVVVISWYAGRWAVRKRAARVQMEA